MTARSGRDGHRSVEGERRRGPKDRGETECQGEGDGGHEGGHEHPEPGRAAAGAAGPEDKEPENSEREGGDSWHGGQDEGDGGGDVIPDTHDLECSAFLSFWMMLWLVLLTGVMSEQLAVGAYLAWAVMSYVPVFALGFLLGRREPADDRGRGWELVGFGCRMTVLLIAGGFMVQGLVGAGDETWAGWEPPLVWVPALLLPTIAVGGGFDGALLGGIARGLPRRTPWHALHFIVSERRRAAAERTQQETKS